MKIEEYAIIGDCKTAALVGCDGSIDWLCWPRFDSPACFAALLGDSDNGRWLIAPDSACYRVQRHYRPGTLILETEFETATGRTVVIDFMPPGSGHHVVRVVAGRSGRVAFQTELVVRFNYGATVPWVDCPGERHTLNAIAGPEQLVLRTSIQLRGEDLKTVPKFTVDAGDVVPFVLSHGPHLKTFRQQSIPSAHWRIRTPSGLNGPIVVPNWAVGRMRSNGHSSPSRR